MTESEQIAAFLATRGVTRVAAGVATLGHLSRRDWRKAVRDPAGVASLTQAAIDARYVTVDDRGREWTRNGLGEVISVE